jgi:hypothetical protein
MTTDKTKGCVVQRHAYGYRPLQQNESMLSKSVVYIVVTTDNHPHPR